MTQTTTLNAAEFPVVPSALVVAKVFCLRFAPPVPPYVLSAFS